MKLTEARQLIKDLSPALVQHIERARRLSRELARAHGISQNRAALAMLLHDVARNLDETHMINLAQSFGLDITERDLQMPLLLHGPVGAKLLERDHGVKDAEILEAVSVHTTGRPGMGKFAKVVFLADKLESGKTKDNPGLEVVLQMADRNLNGAMLAYLGWEKERLSKSGLSLHPLTQKTLEYLIDSFLKG